jgi:V/A-type H+-transporting ATPase subunit D
MTLRKRLVFAEKGENFLEFKREQLIFQIKKLFKDYLVYRKEFIKVYSEALRKLYQTYKEMGKRSLTLISKLSNIQFTPTINVQYVKKIGIVVPEITYELKQEEKLPAYTFENTSHYIDDLNRMLKDLFLNIFSFSEREDLMLKHALNFKKINRRINGLKNVIIPRLKLNVKHIKDLLEEIQRENYVRLKKIKDIIIEHKY